jgi:hypothetical protein
MPNKPTEPVFHQCADIAIVPGPVPPTSGSIYAYATTGHHQAVKSLAEG